MAVAPTRRLENGGSQTLMRRGKIVISIQSRPELQCFNLTIWTINVASFNCFTSLAR